MLQENEKCLIGLRIGSKIYSHQFARCIILPFFKKIGPKF